MTSEHGTGDRPGGSLRIGVLALQGAFQEHTAALELLNRRIAEGLEPELAGWRINAVEVRLPEQLAGLDGLILPGGESTTMGKLAEKYKLDQALRDFIAGKHPVYGTCAGLILLARDIGQGSKQGGQPLLGTLDVQVDRNAFGPQLYSFEAPVAMPALGECPFPAVFIRAPLITAAGPKVEVLGNLDDGRIVAAREGNILVTAFHPELSNDLRMHRYFVEMVAQSAANRTQHPAS